MTINISIQDVGQNLRPQITVLGVGGSGGNAVNNMINEFAVAVTRQLMIMQDKDITPSSLVPNLAINKPAGIPMKTPGNLTIDIIRPA